MAAAEITNGAKTIEARVIETGRKLGVAINPVEWSPEIPPHEISIAEGYSLKMMASLKGNDEIFEILFPREWVEDSSSGAIAENAERKMITAITEIKEKLLD